MKVSVYHTYYKNKLLHYSYTTYYYLPTETHVTD